MPCGQIWPRRRGRHRRTRPSFSRWTWTGPNDGAVRVVKTHGWVATVSGTALAAAQPGADELVGVGPVDLGAGRAAGGAAGLARDRQDAAGLVDGGVAVQQFAGGPVDVIDAASQQNGLQAPAWVPGRACGEGIGGQRWYSSRRALAGGWTSGGRPVARRMSHRGSVISGAMPRVAWSGCLPLRRLCVWLWHRDRAPGDSPARHFTVIPRCGGYA